MERRLDLRAAERRLRSARALADAAGRDSATQLDLGLSVGYNGRVDGRSSGAAMSALGYPARGPNVALTLNYTLPASGYERRGAILQREAAAEQARIELDALHLRVAGDVRTQLDALRAAIVQLDTANQQQQLQTKIYENEKRSYQAGLSSLMDLFAIESQLSVYQVEWVQAQRNFAQAVILFRYQTASLVPTDRDGGSLHAITLTTLPDPVRPTEFFK
jgi:outer membrane protein TolC